MEKIELPKTLPEAHALIERLLDRIERLQRLVEKQTSIIDKQARRIEELERRLGMNSQNSSKPPSSDPPGVPPRPRKGPTGRKPGGQNGHEGHQRALLPPEQVDHIEMLWPDRCEQCACDLRKVPFPVEVGDAIRHQVTEIPPARATVVEYRMHAQDCPNCGHATTAALPAGVPVGSFGPRLQAVVAVLSGVYRLSKRSIKSALADLFGVDMSLGGIIACEQRTSAALAAPVAEVRDYVQQQAVLNADETSWREGRKKAWLWVAVTAYATAFMIHTRRGTAAAKQLLGAFAGILGSDRWCAYAHHRLRKRQLCWAHLRRHFEDFSQHPGAPGLIGDLLSLRTEGLFRHWHKARDETWSLAKLRRTIAPIRHSIDELLRRGSVCGHRKVEGTCKDLLAHGPALWTFTRVPGVEPTNNAAERALRHAVIMRKTSFGTHSEDGSRFIERMLTTVATLRQQDRDVVGYIQESCERALRQQPPRSLLPATQIMTKEALAATDH